MESTPFARIPEKNRPTPTGKMARHGGVEYFNPCLPSDISLCIGDGKTDRLMQPSVWNMLCDRIEASAASDLLRIVKYLGQFVDAGVTTIPLFGLMDDSETETIADAIRAAISKAEAPATTLP